MDVKILPVKMAEYGIARDHEILTCIGLGSCVGIALYDAVVRMGGLAHIMLPRWTEALHPLNHCAKFSDSAIAMMVQDMERLGASSAHIQAKIFGGANMFPSMQTEILNVGEKNIAAIRTELANRKIRIIAEDLGGSSGRTIFFDTRDGSVRVKSIYGKEKVY